MESNSIRISNINYEPELSGLNMDGLFIWSTYWEHSELESSGSSMRFDCWDNWRIASQSYANNAIKWTLMAIKSYWIRGLWPSTSLLIFEEWNVKWEWRWRRSVDAISQPNLVNSLIRWWWERTLNPIGRSAPTLHWQSKRIERMLIRIQQLYSPVGLSVRNLIAIKSSTSSANISDGVVFIKWWLLNSNLTRQSSRLYVDSAIVDHRWNDPTPIDDRWLVYTN